MREGLSDTMLYFSSEFRKLSLPTVHLTSTVVREATPQNFAVRGTKCVATNNAQEDYITRTRCELLVQVKGSDTATYYHTQFKTLIENHKTCSRVLSYLADVPERGVLTCVRNNKRNV
jgi:hypothetical protein